MKAYKGFNKDMTCRGFQYEEGGEYTHDGDIELCESGFHACIYPLDVFVFYTPNRSEFREVEIDDDCIDDSMSESGYDEEPEDTKVVSKHIKIGAKLDIAGMVQASIDYVSSRAKKLKAKHVSGRHGASSATGDYGASSATGYCGASSATGYCGASSATGNYGVSSATGYYGASSATGYCGASSATGDCGASSATGNYGASSATGDYGASSATGNCGASSATGNYGVSSATGNYGASSATGNCGASSATGYYGASSADNPTAVAVAWGYKSRAKGVKGAYLVFADWVGDERRPYDPEAWTLKGAKMVQVDGEIIKADTWYRIIDGEVVEDKRFD